jgi:YHS domain-containing protein/ferredoxin
MLRILFPYLLFGSMILIVILDNSRGGSEVRIMRVGHAEAGGEESEGTEFLCETGEDYIPPDNVIGRDPVCNMDVGPTIAASLDGERYFFCIEQCRELFLQDPELYLQEICLVCRTDDDERVAVSEEDPAYTWQGTTYRFCGDEHRHAFAGDPAGYFIHTMWGIPGWMYSISVAVTLVLSFGLFELISRWSRDRKIIPPRVNFFAIPGLRRLVRWPPFRFLCQAVFVYLFLLVIAAGLFGNQHASRNVAPLLTWTIWWGGLVLVIMFMGKAWCYVCPWDAIAGWIDRRRFWGTGGEGLSLGLRWPRRLRNIVLATLLFVGLTWLELGFGVTMNPRATALLGLLMLGLTLAAVLIFERRAFCRYGCLVGRVSGLYAMFSATEVRPADRDICRACSGKECYTGSELGVGCPTGLFPGNLQQNTYCINCLECVKTCPEDNIVFNARPWASDLASEGRPRRDEAYLALLMLALTGFHGLTMTPAWGKMLRIFEEGLSLPYIPAFSLGMFLLMAIPVLVYALLVKGSEWLAGPARRHSYDRIFTAFAYSVLPIALFYHLAHNMEHLLMEGQKVIPLLSNPFGFIPGEAWNVLGIEGQGPWNLLGTADWTLPPLVSLPALWLLQVILVLVGHLYSLWIADRTARRLYPERGTAWRTQIPMLIGMVLFSVFSLWLLKQPMEMRTSAM